MYKFLIIKTGGTFESYAKKRNDFEHWTARGMGLDSAWWDCVDVQSGESLPAPATYAGCVITGSHDMVTDDAPWMQDTKAWIRSAYSSELPLLGICFGHQLMADALGGKADYHPDGLEIGTTDVTLNDTGKADPLLGSLPTTFKAHVTHSQTVLELPPEAIPLAANSHDSHQAFRMGEHAWGLQFHPEFDAEAIRYYIGELSDKIEGQGDDADAIAASVDETPDSAAILRRFVDYCQNCR